jgi:fructose-1,6-bisphosphatase/inositol monophosphatase family enzyme
MSPVVVDQDLLDFAVALADKAGRVAAERFFAADFGIASKHDGSGVTDADFAVEQLIRSELRRRFPEDEVYGEEAGLTAGVSGRVMVTGHLGGIAGVLTGLLDAIVIGGFEMELQDLAPLPVILEEAGGRVTDLTGGSVLSGSGAALISTGRTIAATAARMRNPARRPRHLPRNLSHARSPGRAANRPRSTE